MKKSLPIKFIAKRKVDEQLKEAGGSKELPKWVMQGDSLAQRSRNLTGSMSRIDAEFQAHERENLTCTSKSGHLPPVNDTILHFH